MSNRSTRYRVRAVSAVAAYDEETAYSRRTEALKAAARIVNTWSTVETVTVTDTRYGTGDPVLFHYKAGQGRFTIERLA